MLIDFATGGALKDGTVVVGVHAGGRLSKTAHALDGGGGLTRAVAAGRFVGEFGAVLSVYAPFGIKAPRVVLLGLGDPETLLTEERARRLGGRLAKELLKGREETATVALEAELTPETAAAMALGLRLAAYRPLRTYHTQANDDAPRLTGVTLRVADPVAARERWDAAEAVAKGMFLARDLVNEPANALGPDDFVARLRDLERLGVTVEAIAGDDLLDAGLALLHAVGRASARPPVLCVLKWSGSGEGRPLALVGKGVTFDTGGLSIKPAENMHEMKMDMAGAAAVAGAVGALAARRCPTPVIGVLALAENMPGANALRPGDVVKSFAGLTVEAVDTDAEGRLILADALAYAAATFKPRAIIDLATLTGSVVVTLGKHRAGLFSNDDALAARLLAAGEATGERLWRLPLSPDHDDDALKSDIADLRNCAWGRFLPDALHAARFLERFIEGGKTPWAHVDIAGVADTEDDDYPLGPKGATGFGVALLVAAVMSPDPRE